MSPVATLARRAEARFGNALDLVPDAIVMVDNDGRIVLVNRQAETMFGYRRRELVGQPVELLLPERFRAVHTGNRRQYITAPHTRPMGAGLDLYARRNDGAEFPVEISLSSVMMDGDLLVMSTIRDITARRQTEEVVQASEARFRALAESLIDAVVSADSQGHITYWNRGAETIFGYRAAEVMGQPLTLLMPASYHEGHRAGLARLTAGGPPQVIGRTVQMVGRRKDDAEFPLELSLSSWHTDEGLFYTGVIRDISERDRAEDALRRSERLLRLINDNTDAAIFAWDMERRRTYVNPAIEALTGYKAEEMLGDESINWVHPDDVGWLRPFWDSVFGGASYTAEYRVITKHGESKWARSSWGPIYDEHGAQIGVQGSVRDITAGKAMEGALRASEERFRGLTESAPDAMVVVDLSGAIVLVNAQTERRFGYTRDELIGQSVDLLVPDHLRTRHAAHRSGYVAQPRVREMGAGLNLYGRRKDGTEFPVEISLSPFGSGEGQVILSAIRDISERRQAERARVELAREQAARAEAEAMAEQLRQLQSITDIALTHLALDDLLDELLRRIQQVLSADTAAILLLGEGGDRLIERAATWRTRDAGTEAAVPVGSGFAGRVAAEGRPVVIDDIDAIEIVNPHLREQGVRSLLGISLVADGALIGVLHVGARRPHHFSNAEAGLLDLVADRVALAIHQAYMYEAERTARAEAEVAGRVKDEFLSTAAHELKTPITSMKAYAQLLLKQSDPTTGAFSPRALSALNRQCDRLGRLVQDLLEVSRLALGRVDLRPQPFALDALASEVVERMQTLSATHHLRLTTDGPVEVNADQDRIEQVLVNLIGNAIKFSPGGGDIDVRLRLVDGEAVVEVEDRGVGIEAERQGRLFEQFYRAHDPSRHHFEGMGIGLHLSREMVRRHGGRMWFTSTAGSGSTFCFSLPQARDAEDIAATPSTQTT